MKTSLAQTIYKSKYSKDGIEEWEDTVDRVLTAVMPSYKSQMAKYFLKNQFKPGGRYLFASGRPIHQVNNCVLLSVDDSRESWADLLRRVFMALSTGAGIGIEYSKIRPEGTPIGKIGGVASGPIALMQIVNEIGRNTMQGGSRRSAIWAGLHWKHADIFKFIKVKDWDQATRQSKEDNYLAVAPMDNTNVSVRLDTEFFEAMSDENHEWHQWAKDVYWQTVESMLRNGEPGFSNDWDDQILRNACTEVVSAENNDICNLGSLNMAAFDTLAEFKDAIFWATGFLVHGLLYSHLPYEEIEAVRKKNSRLGLGLMGIAHWFYKKGLKYGEITEEVTKWFQTYKDESDRAAKYWAKKLGVAEPIAVRAIAPTGTIALISDTTSGIEPPYLLAYRRMWLEQGKTYMAQNCIDAAAQALIADGVLPENIETAYDLAKEPERRIAFQYWVQQFVDQSISSTLNLPSWGSEYNNPSTVETFGSMLLKYLPGLRGITTYPDGARGGQPISPIDYQEALATQGITYEVNDQCKSGVCGI